MVEIASSFALVMKPHVLITMASAMEGCATSVCPFAVSIPIIFSLSTRFLLQPSEINPTFISYHRSYFNMKCPLHKAKQASLCVHAGNRVE